MAAFSMAIVAILLLLLGIIIGVKLGGELAKQCVTRKEYWIANLKIIGVGVVVSALVTATGWLLLAGIPAVCCVSLAVVQLLALVPPVRRWALLMRDRTR